MWKQSARIYYQGKDHKAICLNLEGEQNARSKRYTTAVYKNGFIFYYIFGESMFSGTNGVGLINERTGFDESKGRIFIINDGFLKVTAEGIAYSKNCSDWTYEIDFSSDAYTRKTTKENNNCLFWLSESSNEVSCYDHDKNEISQFTLQERVYPVDISNNSENFIVSNVGDGGKRFYLVNKMGEILHIELREDVVDGDNRVFRYEPIYAQRGKVYFIKETQTVTENPTKIRKNIYLACAEGEGVEQTIATIESTIIGAFINYSAIKANVLSIENGAKILYGDKLLTLNENGDVEQISVERWKPFEVDLYANNRLVGTVKFTVNRFSHSHLYVENGMRKKNGFIYNTAIYEGNGKYRACVVLIRDLFASKRNIAIETN